MSETKTYTVFVNTNRAVSIAAGRTTELRDGKYIPLGVAEEAPKPEPKEAEHDQAEGLGISKGPLQQLRDLVAIQGSDGNWDVDDYMVGMFNGMELALATMEGREPQFRKLKVQKAKVAPEPKRAPLDWNKPTSVDRFPGFTVTRYDADDLMPTAPDYDHPLQKLTDPSDQLHGSAFLKG